MSSILVTLLDRARRLLAWRWMPIIVNSVVLVLVVLAVGNQAWALFGRAEPPPSAVPPPRGVQVAIDPLMAQQLFGVSRRGGPGGGAAPLSSLNVALAGVIPTLEGGFALISVNGQPQETYSVGQEIVPGTVLRKVQADRVLVERSGLTETLLLQEAVAATDTVAAGGPVPGSAAATAAPAAASPPVPVQLTPPGQQARPGRGFSPDQIRQRREERKRQREERRQRSKERG